MKILQNDILLLGISTLLVIASLFIVSTPLAIAVSVVIAAFAFINKKSGLLVLAVAVPLRPFLITVNPGLKLLLDLIILGLLVRTFYDYRKNIKKLFEFQWFELTLFAFWIIGSITALINGVSVTAVIMQLRTYVVFYVLYYVVKRMKREDFPAVKLAAVTFVTATVMSLQGIVEKISNKTLLMPEEWTNWILSATNQVRVYGLIKGPNELSLYLIMAFIISLFLLKKVSGKFKPYIYVGLVLMSTTFFLTFSRGAFLCIGAFLVLYILFTRKIKPLIIPAAIIMVSGLLFFGVGYTADWYKEAFNAERPTYSGSEAGIDKDGKGSVKEGVNRYKDVFSEDQLAKSNAGGRIYYVKKSLEIFKDYPVVGTGFATFGSAATLSHFSPFYEDYDIQYKFYSDNQYITILTETGAIGVLLVAITFFLLIVYVWKYKKDYYFSPLILFLMGTLIVGSLVYNILENDVIMVFFFVLLGVVGQYKNEEKASI